MAMPWELTLAATPPLTKAQLVDLLTQLERHLENYCVDGEFADAACAYVANLVVAIERTEGPLC